MASMARLDESDMLRKPGEVYQTGNRFFEVDVWGVSHPIKKSILATRKGPLTR